MSDSANILTAALTVLQDQGAQAFTVRAVAEAAGCSTTGIYTHFGGKSGLVEAIYVDGFESLERSLADAYAADDLMAAGQAYRRWALANPTQYLVMFGRAVPDFDPSPLALDRATRSFGELEKLVALIGADHPPTTAYHLHASIHGHVMLELVGLVPADAQRLEELLLDGLRLTLSRLV